MPGAPYNDAYPVGVQLKPYPHVPSDLRADGRRHPVLRSPPSTRPRTRKAS